MSRVRPLLLIPMAAAALALGACKPKPQTAPIPAGNTPSGPVTAADSARQRDSIALANRQADSIAAENARRAREAAVADSVRRVNEAAAAALTSVRNAMTTVIYFDFDRSELRPEAQAALDAKLPIMKANPDVRIRIDGHADERGSDEYNLALGMRRATIAKRYLTDRGIDAARIDVGSFGEEHPVCTASEESCWSQNRRDEFSIVVGGDTMRTP